MTNSFAKTLAEADASDKLNVGGGREWQDFTPVLDHCQYENYKSFSRAFTRMNADLEWLKVSVARNLFESR